LPRTTNGQTEICLTEYIQKISDLYTNPNSKKGIGRDSYINDQNQKIFELVKLDTLSSEMLPYLTGKIEDLKIKRSFQRDSTIFIYEMKYAWNVRDPKEVTSKLAKVYEITIMDIISEQAITIVQINFLDSNEEFYAWDEHSNPDQVYKKGISFPLFLKIKSISYQPEDSNDLIYMKKPQEKINYALWTKNAFYRYAKNGLKDKIEFAAQTDSINTTPFNTMISYKNTKGKGSLYMNNYYEDDPEEYVSTIDINQFPIESDDPIISFGNAIVWEKLNPAKKYMNMSIKLEYVDKKGFSKKEIISMEKEIDILELMIIDYKNELNMQ